VEAITKQPGDRCDEHVDDDEGRSRQTELGIREPEIRLDGREHGEEHLPVDEVEQIDDAERAEE
jgi:hypothetical protein